ncbi:hypothetical protein OB905_13845 [Halobacteria archaeon AArc-dxtr1]|nr:hypothetical protein [Halobacteria archaeon AArc-dxtr1]
MTEATFTEIESDLGRASELERESAIALLEKARRRLESCEDDPDVDEERRRELERRVKQHLRTVRNRDAYGDEEELGAALNPDEDDAP